MPNSRWGRRPAALTYGYTKVRRNGRSIGEIAHKGQWYPGQQEPLIDRMTWDRVQTLLGTQYYTTHLTTYGGELIQYSHCGHPITGEVKIKLVKSAPVVLLLPLCPLHRPGDPRTRIP